MQSNLDKYGGGIHIYSTVTHMSHISFLHHHMRGGDEQSHMATYGARCHVYIIVFTYPVIWIMFCYMTSETRPYLQLNVDKYGKINPLYLPQLSIWLLFFSLTFMTSDQNHRFRQKDSFCLFYLGLIHIYHICTFWTKIQGYYFKGSMLPTWIIFHFFSYMKLFQLLQRREGVGICWN